jgi:hypothetical protein
VYIYFLNNPVFSDTLSRTIRLFLVREEELKLQDENVRLLQADALHTSTPVVPTGFDICNDEAGRERCISGDNMLST